MIIPAFASLYGEGASDRIRSGFGRALRLLLLVALPAHRGGAAVGPRCCSSSSTARSTATAGTVLLVLITAYPFVSLASLGGRAPPRAGQAAAARSWRCAGAAAVDIALALLLVPELEAVGAAIANVGGQVALAVPLLAAAIRATGRPRLEAGALVRAAVAAARRRRSPRWAATLLGGIAGVVVGMLVFTLVFAALARVLRILPNDDAGWLDDAIGARFGGLARTRVPRLRGEAARFARCRGLSVLWSC